MSEVLGDNNVEYYTPIGTLTAFSINWRIKARVTQKHALKEWKNDKTSGKLLQIELIDV
jgi:replication factor A1